MRSDSGIYQYYPNNYIPGIVALLYTYSCINSSIAQLANVLHSEDLKVTRSLVTLNQYCRKYVTFFTRPSQHDRIE